MNSTLYDVDFTRTLPSVLKEDERLLALGQVIAIELQRNIHMSRLNIIYPRIDELDETLLDILAYDLHIDWYNPDSSPDIKREIIKESVRVHKRLGTKYAVESVVRAYFGSGEVREWYEYGGDAHHFKIISSNPSITNEQATRFFQMLEVVKRKSSWLDSVLISLTGDSFLYLGTLIHEFAREAHIIAPQDNIDQFLPLIVTGVYVERAAEKHIMGPGRGLKLYFGTAFYERVRETNAILGTQDISTMYFKALFYERTRETSAISSGKRNQTAGTMFYEWTSEQHFLREE
jgi:phage tail P2-like protein